MAYSLRNNAIAVPRFFSPLSRSRYFSSLPARQAAPNAKPADRRMRNQRQLPTDLGLLTNTFIKPSLSHQLSLLKTPKSFVKLQWMLWKARVMDMVSIFAMKFSSPRVGRMKYKIQLDRHRIVPTAKGMHDEMYKAFAEGDSKTLHKICADGLYESFMGRIGARPKGEKIEWELVRMNGTPKIISHRAATLPVAMGAGSFLRQAVVRIASRQKMTRKSRNGEVVPGSGKEKDVVEYLVLQMFYRGYEPGEWRVWGTTEETTLERAEEWEEEAVA
ncbi:Mitochondrial inner membrane Mba1 protein [Rutstroemia sp. NJR-2017a WRK4]|nr:Mitochondrial inner membrane Mba1 protein [Rutstroemia sp. NJR-2017a WRK4]